MLHRLPLRLRSAALGLCAAAVVLTLTSIPPALGVSPETLYVDGSSPSCSNSGSGAQGAPFCTIGAAVAKVAPGQTVQVAGGTYSEKVSISKSGTATAPITFSAAPGATVTVTGGTNGFVISGRSWVTVNGFTVTNTSDYGITVSNSTFITISNNDVSHAGFRTSGMTRGGIRLNNSTDSLIVGNKSHDNSYAGIMVVGGSTRNEVRGNETFGNARGFERAAPGIRIYQSPANVVDNNITHDNEDSGIESYSGANDTLIYNNVSFNNGDHGIDDLRTTGQRIIGNTVYKNVTAGINLEGNSTGGTIRNNICVDNGIRSPRTHSDIRVENGSTAGTTVDYNVVYLTTPDTLLIWSSVSYTKLAAFQAASGQMSHGLNADPRWRDIGARDFHLGAGSPAIDYADSATSGQPALDAEDHPRVDDPATVDTGAGPRTYDDAGAFEFQPSSLDVPPSASLTVTPSSGPAPLTVTADASGSTDTDATPIASYSFDFGDGSATVGPQAGASAGHSYAAAGTYTVTMTVTDTGGKSSTASAQVTVSAAANLVTNAGFETDLSGWNTSGSTGNIDLARVAGGHSGGWAAQLTNTGTSAGTADLNDSPNWVKTTLAGNYVGGIWARADSPGAIITLRFREYNGSTLVRTTSAQATLTTSWQQVSVTHTAAAPGTSTLDFNAYVPKAAPGAVFYADDASIVSP
jgi:parallel beta-helix repeat protein